MKNFRKIKPVNPQFLEIPKYIIILISGCVTIPKSLRKKNSENYLNPMSPLFGFLVLCSFS